MLSTDYPCPAEVTIGSISNQDMSYLRATITAISVGDLHYDAVPPPIWGTDVDYWRNIQFLYTKQFCDLSNELKCPILINGDIFNNGDANAELINFVINCLQQSTQNKYGIPGQHDLINHNYEDIERTAYWTLVKAGVLINVPYKDCVHVESKKNGLPNLCLYGFPWKQKVYQCTNTPMDKWLYIAMIHAYIWKGADTAYEGAPNSSLLVNWVEKLQGYNVALFGDNHKGFHWGQIGGEKLFIHNGGGFIIRKSNEIGYRPFIGLVHASGKVIKCYLDTSIVPVDKYVIGDKSKQQTKSNPELTAFMQELGKFTDAAINFQEFCVHKMEELGVGDSVREFITSKLAQAQEELK